MRKKRKTKARAVQSRPRPQKRKTRKAKKTMRRRIFLLFSCFVVLSTVFTGLTFVFLEVFKINNIYVEGNTKYDDKEIIKSSGISIEDNLCFANASKAEEEIYRAFPYVETVKIKKKLLKTIKINVEISEPQFAVKMEDGYLIISKSGKILERSEELPTELVGINGANFSPDEDGVKLIYENSALLEALNKSLNAFKENYLYGIKEIDVSDFEHITVNYDNRITIIIGKYEDIPYKILTAREILNNKIGSSEKGTLDLRSLKNNNRSYFTPA